MGGRLREVAPPFVVAGPAGARVRTRLRVTPVDAAVLAAAGAHLGSLASADLAARCREGRLDARGRAVSRAVRKRAVTGGSSSRWAGAIEHGLDDVAREINRELGYLSVLESRDAAGVTPAEAVAAGGAALDRVLAMVDDCEWRLRRAEAEGKDTSMLPDPDELRRRLGIPARTRR